MAWYQKTCPECEGRKRVSCYVCRGYGTVPNRNAFYPSARVVCTRCNGNGSCYCYTCNGNGHIEVETYKPVFSEEDLDF